MYRYDATAIGRLCADLDLPSGDVYSQDWVYEIPEEYRTLEHLERYADVYRTRDYAANERGLLMHPMLDITNDLFGANEDSGLAAWHIVGNLLRNNHSAHPEEFEYWSVMNSPIEDAFAITPFIRRMAEDVDIR